MRSKPSTLIWDLPTRIFHWLLAFVVSLQFITGFIGGDLLNWHANVGYLTLTLILFRIFWGFLGGYWSLFKSYVPSARQLLDFLKTLGYSKTSSAQESNVPPQSTPFAGHNPLGAISVLVMLLGLALQVISGMMSNDDVAFAGPLTPHISNDTVEWMTWYHSEVGFYLIIFQITLHILAIVYYKVHKGEVLTASMIHGYKKIEAPIRASGDSTKNRMLALALFLLSSLIVYSVLLLVR